MKIESPYEFGTMIEVLGDNWIQGSFVGMEGGWVVIEPRTGGIFRSYAHHRPLAPKKTRLMTSRELAGKWIRFEDSSDKSFLVTCCRGDYVVFFIDECLPKGMCVDKSWKFTSTPADDSSWKSVEVECE